LQAIISQQIGSSDKQAYIPTPPTNLSSLQYDRLYSPNYKHPHSYIRFSSTVEDCVGVPYCMDQEDEIYLVNLNSGAKKSPSKRSIPCSEDQFEQVMSFFEEISSNKQPYASVDNSPVLSYAEMEQSFDETIDDTSRIFAKDIYEHWKRRREEHENHPLMPSLKFERNVGADDSDPYVCFRRREVRQARKTRGRDAQITEKLKKLRQELEQARQILHLTKQRELGRKDQLVLDRFIFDQRVAVKEAKRNLGIKGDDQDLVNQRPVERVSKPDSAVLRKLIPPGKEKEFQDTGLHLLSEDRAKRESEVNAIIADSMVKHKTWNHAYVDNTWRPITPPLESGFKNSFREAITEYLPTPPASSSEEHADGQRGGARGKPADQPQIPFRYASPPIETATPGVSFRRRVGRGGRLWIDRRGLSRKRKWEDDNVVDDAVLERYEFDVESDDEPEIYMMDPYDSFHMKHRVELMMMASSGASQVHAQNQISLEQMRRMQEIQRRQQQAAGLPNGHHPNGLSPTQQRMAVVK
jgi:enhancer of polycomb-like protein